MKKMPKRLIKVLALSSLCGHMSMSSEAPKAPTPKKECSNLTIYRDGGFIKLERALQLDNSTASHIIDGVPASVLKETFITSIGDPNVSILDYEFHPQGNKSHNISFSLTGTPVFPQTNLRYQYAFQNISWNTSYAFHFSANYQKVHVNSWLEVKNQTDVDFPRLNLQFIDTNLPFSSVPESKEEDPHPANKGGHTYFLNNVSALARQSSKYFNWSSAHDVTVNQDYRIFVGAAFLEDMGGKSATPPVETWVSFANVKEQGMGVPLPLGTATLSCEDTNGHVQVLGKTEIPHTDSGQEVSVKIPNLSFEGSASLGVKRLRFIETELVQTEYKKLDKTIEANYRLSIRNKLPLDASEADKKPISIRVPLDFPEGAEWVVVRENIGHQQNGSNQIYWIVQVSPGTDVDLKYRIRITR